MVRGLLGGCGKNKMNTLILAVCFNVLMFVLVVGGLIWASCYLPPNKSMVTIIANSKFVAVAIVAVSGTWIFFNYASRLKVVQ